MVATAAVEGVRTRLGRVGVWMAPAMLLTTSIEAQRRELERIEHLGYGSLWSGEPPAGAPVGGREAFTQHGLMLAATERMSVGVGIANIQMRHAVGMHTGAATLAEAYPGRFVLGVGGQTGERPLTDLRGYLEAMDASAAAGLLPEVRFPRVLAALGPKMLALAADRADGAHSFLQPVEHTAIARQALGPDKLLIPHQAVVLDTDATAARAVMRAVLGPSGQSRSPYTESFRRLGYGEDDLAGDRSDRLIDAILAWGDETAVAKRVREHLDAGADHVLVHPLAGDLPSLVSQLERLAPVLLGLA